MYVLGTLSGPSVTQVPMKEIILQIYINSQGSADTMYSLCEVLDISIIHNQSHAVGCGTHNLQKT